MPVAYHDETDTNWCGRCGAEREDELSEQIDPSTPPWNQTGPQMQPFELSSERDDPFECPGCGDIVEP